MELLSSTAIEFIKQIDTDFLLVINGMHTPVLDKIMYTISMRSVWIPMYILLFLLLRSKKGWKTALLGLIVIGIGVTIADQLCGSVLRGLMARMRPSNPDNPISHLVHIFNDYRGGYYGFPSCHASNTAVVAMLLSLWFRKQKIIILLSTWVILVSFSRIYLGVHYPGDIITGIIIGCIIAYLLNLLFFVIWPYVPTTFPRLPALK